MSGRQEAVTGVRDTVTASRCSTVSGQGRDRWSSQSVKGGVNGSARDRRDRRSARPARMVSGAARCHRRRRKANLHDTQNGRARAVQSDSGVSQAISLLACPARLSGGLRVAVFQLERFKYRLSHSRSNSRGSHRRAPSLEKIIELVKVGSRRQLHAVLIAISLLTCVSQRSRRM